MTVLMCVTDRQTDTHTKLTKDERKKTLYQELSMVVCAFGPKAKTGRFL